MLKKKSFAIIAAVLIACSLIIVVAASQQWESVDVIQEGSASSTTSIQYADVLKNDWFYDDVVNVSKKGLMNGTSDTTFSPADNTNRAMIVTILWRLEGKPIEGDNNFADVVKGQYYYDAVSWATKNKIVSGYDSKTFAPTDAATREQLVTIMYRYATYKNYDLSNTATLYKFTDSNFISEYAIKALEWGVANKIITGTSDSTLSPTDHVQRCQLAAILRRFCENFKSFEKQDEVKDDGDTTNNTNDETKDVNEDSVDNEQFDDEPIIGAGGGPDESIIDKEDIPEYEPEIEESQRPSIKVNTTYGDPGETIIVNLDLENNPGILGMILQLEYDENAMTLVGVDNGEAIADVLTLTTSRELKSGVKFVWDGIEISPNQIKNGTMLSLEFVLSDNVIPGKRYPLTLKYNDGEIIDSNFVNINPRIYQGFIEIEQEN